MITSSILNSVKKSLGIMPECTDFDQDIIMAINTVFNILTQLGVGPSDGFQIDDTSNSWTDFIKDNKRLNMVKSYIYAKVRLIFDPPQLTSVTECLKEIVKELECRMSYEVDPSDTFDETGGDDNGTDDGDPVN